MTNKYTETVIAVQFTGTMESVKELLDAFDWATHNLKINFTNENDDMSLIIDAKDFSRGIKAKTNDYLIQQPNGDFMVKSADRFKDLYKETK